MAAIGDYGETYAMLDIGLSQLLLVSHACLVGGCLGWLVVIHFHVCTLASHCPFDC